MGSATTPTTLAVPLTGTTYILGYSELVGPSADITTAIGSGPSAPTITEGNQILTVTVTPNFIGSRLIVDVSSLAVEFGSSAISFTLALFKDGATNAVRAATTHGITYGTEHTGGLLCMKYSFVTVSLTPIVFTVRAGWDTVVAGNKVNQSRDQSYGEINLGNTISSTLQVTEVK